MILTVNWKQYLLLHKDYFLDLIQSKNIKRKLKRKMTLYTFLLWVEQYGGTFKTHIYFFVLKKICRALDILSRALYLLCWALGLLSRALDVLSRELDWLYLSIYLSNFIFPRATNLRSKSLGRYNAISNCIKNSKW